MTVTVSVMASGTELELDRVAVLKVVGMKVTVTVFSGISEVLEDSVDVDAMVCEDCCADELMVTVVWAVSVNVGVIVTVIRVASELAGAELVSGTAPPRALATVASSKHPTCTPATVSIGKA